MKITNPAGSYKIKMESLEDVMISRFAPTAF